MVKNCGFFIISIFLDRESIVLLHTVFNIYFNLVNVNDLYGKTKFIKQKNISIQKLGFFSIFTIYFNRKIVMRGTKKERLYVYLVTTFIAETRVYLAWLQMLPHLLVLLLTFLHQLLLLHLEDHWNVSQLFHEFLNPSIFVKITVFCNLSWRENSVKW